MRTLKTEHGMVPIRSAFVACVLLAFSTGLASSAAVAGEQWSGPYIGLNAGYSWANSDVDYTVPGNGAGFFAFADDAAFYSAVGSNDPDFHGFTGGAQAGFNFQTGNILAGIEVDIGILDLSGDETSSGTPAGLAPAAPLTSVTSVSTDWLSTVRGRLGFLRDRTLFYVSGGVAFAKIDFEQSNTYTIPGTGVRTQRFSDSSTEAGWVAGAGIEHAIDNKLVARIEYLHVGLGDVGGSTTFPGVTTETFSHEADLKANIIRVGISRRF